VQIAYIGVFQHLPANSGNDWYSLQLVDDLKEIGDVTLYYTLQENGKRGYSFSDPGFKQRRLPPTVKWRRISRRLDQLRPEILFDGSAVMHIRADLVIARLYSYHMARHVAKNNNAPIVIVMQNIEWQYLKNAGYSPLVYAPVRPYESFVLRKAAAVTAISLQDHAYATKRTAAKKVFYVPYRPNDSVFNTDMTSCYDYGTDRLNVLFYGSLDRQHNVKAVEFIKHDLIPRMKQRGLFHLIKIHVVGSGVPPDHLDLEKDFDINFLGWVESPAPYILGADVVIVPVRNPSGVKVRVLEALSCHKPVVAFPEATLGLESELIQAITIANSAEEFAEALKSFVRLGRYSLRSARTDSAHFSIKAVTARDAALYALNGEAASNKASNRAEGLLSSSYSGSR
jgi:glycosyltransferase involved in cell wall biosynthesis